MKLNSITENIESNDLNDLNEIIKNPILFKKINSQIGNILNNDPKLNNLTLLFLNFLLNNSDTI